ncbi:DNA-directed RNA polymerase subunit beta [Haemophilus influenzae]|nr:DNA-directed RNA polymerase subunit beta [Haemophilus influenzae]OXS17887.1 DNA-directed RNA polymerase subunit beta [Haemophilus influenzae]SQJ01297.1 Uncharacterised protein [Haemophilus influenzae]
MNVAFSSSLKRMDKFYEIKKPHFQKVRFKIYQFFKL